MSRKSFNISGKLDKYSLEIISSIEKVTNSLGIPFFIIGATARDIILEHIYNKPVYRATNDIDLGIRINDWTEIEKLSTALIEDDRFTRDARIEHRFYFEKIYPIDIVPFGDIAAASGTFEWPKEKKTFTIIGFEEAYENSDLVTLRERPLLTVNFATAGSLTLLKIISWDEKYPNRSRDAVDIALIIESYLEAGNMERLSVSDFDLVNNEFDFNFTGARLLGRDIATIFNKQAINYILNILNKETGEQQSYRLAEDMVNEKKFRDEKDFEYYLKLIETLKTGILERMKTG